MFSSFIVFVNACITYLYIYFNKQTLINLKFTIPKCLKYKIKGKDYNSQTQQYFYSILMIYNSIMGYMFRLLSSHLQALKTYKHLLHCGILNVGDPTTQ